MQFHITPHTKVIDILTQYPEIEDYLIELVPAFEKLRNPILRNTIGKIATIEQAAKVGEIGLSTLINALNEKLGLLPESIVNSKIADENVFEISDDDINEVLDADQIINSGGKPVGIVLNALHKLQGNKLLQLNCSFHPAPLIDKAKEAGYLAYEKRNEDKSFSIYFKSN